MSIGGERRVLGPGARTGARGLLTTSREAAASLYEVTIKGTWDFLLRQPPSFWLICSYFFIEYVRPQQIYASLAGLPLGEVALALGLGALLLEGKVTRRFNLADGGMILFGAVLLASAALAWDPDQAFGNIKVVVNWVLVYYLVTNLVDTEGRFLVFTLAFLLYSFKMAQHATRSWASVGFSFRAWGATGAPGWFHNSGEFAIQMTIFIPLAVYFVLALKRYWPRWKTWMMWALPACGVVGVLASSSRGGQLGVAAVVLAMAAKSRKKFKALAAVLLVGVAGYAFMPDAQIERWEKAGEGRTSQTRFTYWEDGIEIMNSHPALGIGYDNWLPYYRRYYNPDAGQVPHSIYIEAGAELGYLGLLAFLLLIGLTFYLNYRTRRMSLRCRGDPSFLYYMAHGLDVALVGFLVSGAFVTVLYYPFFWVNLAMTSSLYTVARKKLAASRCGLREEGTLQVGAGERGRTAAPGAAP